MGMIDSEQAVHASLRDLGPQPLRFLGFGGVATTGHWMHMGQQAVLDGSSMAAGKVIDFCSMRLYEKIGKI